MTKSPKEHVPYLGTYEDSDLDRLLEFSKTIENLAGLKKFTIACITGRLRHLETKAKPA